MRQPGGSPAAPPRARPASLPGPCTPLHTPHLGATARRLHLPCLAADGGLVCGSVQASDPRPRQVGADHVAQHGAVLADACQARGVDRRRGTDGDDEGLRRAGQASGAPLGRLHAPCKERSSTDPGSDGSTAVPWCTPALKTRASSRPPRCTRYAPRYLRTRRTNTCGAAHAQQAGGLPRAAAAAAAAAADEHCRRTCRPKKRGPPMNTEPVRAQ